MPRRSEWVRMAADKGVPEAQTALGKMYLGGMGVSGNNEEGLKWFRKAAERGMHRRSTCLVLRT